MSYNKELPIDYHEPIYGVSKDLWNAQSRMADEKNYYSVQPDEKNVLEELEELGFEQVGSGLARVVYRFPEDCAWHDCVVKIGRFGTTPSEIGMFQNQNEIRLWKALCERGVETDYPVVPLRAWDEGLNRWCVMEYGKPVADALPTDSQIETKIETVKRELEPCGAINRIEVADENVMMHDGDAKLGDYGRIDITEYPFVNE